MIVRQTPHLGRCTLHLAMQELLDHHRLGRRASVHQLCIQVAKRPMRQAGVYCVVDRGVDLDGAQQAGGP